MRRDRREPPVVMITGAAGGIGRALAARWAREGARLVLLDIDAEGLADVRGELSTDVLALRCDVTDPAACAAAVEEAVATFGGVDVLVNNAGRTHLGRVEETEPDVFRRILELNTLGAIYMTRAALPHLLRRGGAVAALSSVAGFAPLAGRSGYAASKHALHGFFDSLRAEVAPRGVVVTLVCPAFTRTGIGERALGPDGGAAAGPRTEFGRPLSPERVAAAVVAGVRARRRLVLVGSVSRISRCVVRIAPGLYERLMRRALLRSAP